MSSTSPQPPTGLSIRGRGATSFTFTAIRYIDAMAELTPIESEFATIEDAAAHDAWFRAKVERAMASTAPTIPHDEVMAKMQAIIDRAKQR